MPLHVRRLTRSAACLLLAACAGCADEAATDASRAAAAEGPAMWRVSDDDTTVYLFGTFHILPKSLEWTTPAFEAAMADTDVTVTEADVQSADAQARMGALIAQYGLNPSGVTLSSILGPERAARFETAARRYGIALSQLESQRPWLALLTLAVSAMQKEGFDPQSGAEVLVEARARAAGDRLAYLETAEYQIQALANLDTDEMFANFDATMDQFDDFDRYTDLMLDAWKTGDVTALDSAILAELRRDSPAAFESLFTVRNRNWTRIIDGYLDGEGSYFVAVGAGHLVGEDSVIDLLTDEGWSVERVQ